MADMLMEFETLDATDIKEIMEGTWNADTKRSRVKAAHDLQMKNPPPPPPLPVQNTAPHPVPKPGMEPGLNT